MIHRTSKHFEARSPLDIINHHNITHAERTVCHCSVAGAHRLLPSTQWYLDICESQEQADQTTLFTDTRRASSHISKFMLPPKYPRQGQGTPKHQVLASFQVKSVSASSQPHHVLPQRHFLHFLPARPSHLPAVLLAIWAQMYQLNLLYFCLDFRLPSTTSLPGMHTVLPGPGTDEVQRGFFPHLSSEMQISTANSNFLKHFSATPGKFVNRYGDAAPRNREEKQIQSAAMLPSATQLQQFSIRCLRAALCTRLKILLEIFQLQRQTTYHTTKGKVLWLPFR